MASPGWFEAAVWVDGSTSVLLTDQKGTQNAPYSTILQAVVDLVARQDALPVGNTPGDRGATRQVVVVAGGIYDEDILLTRGDTFYEFVALGPVTLGDGSANVNFGSTVPRSVTWSNTQAQEDLDTGLPNQNRRPQLVFTTFHDMAGDATGTHIQIASGWDISGNLILTNPGGVGQSTTAEVHLANVRIRGNIVPTTDAGIRNFYMRGCRIDGSILAGGSLFLQIAERCRFVGSAIFAFYSRVVESSIIGNFTAELTTAFNGNPPVGFYGCSFGDTDAGTPMTFPCAGTLAVDAASNYWFKAIANVLAGGGSKLILGDLVA